MNSSFSSLFFIIRFLVGLKALETNTPREQAIMCIKVVDSLKDRLKARFASIAEEGRAVTAEDIQEFFEQVKEEQQRKRVKL